jgi:hypothetical protein
MSVKRTKQHIFIIENNLQTLALSKYNEIEIDLFIVFPSPTQ